MRLAIAAATLCVAFAVPFAPTAEAARSDARQSIQSGNLSSRGFALDARPVAHRAGSLGAASRGGFGGGISCVPYARAVTGMAITGNGRDWWHNAAGRYARGHRPTEGSVLAFPGTGYMPMGHVAVVSRVVNPRMIEIDHANWGGPGIRKGMVMRNVRVMDVSADNSWTRVRVQVGWDSGTFGREYPTYGFIHNATDTAYASADSAIRPVSYTARRTVEAARPQPVRAAATPRRAAPTAPRAAHQPQARR